MSKRKVPTGPADATDVFCVSQYGSRLLRYRLVECRAGGWHWYENADTGHRFPTRQWYPHTTPLCALLSSARKDIELARGRVVRARRSRLLDRAARSIECAMNRNWPRSWGYGGRY